MKCLRENIEVGKTSQKVRENRTDTPADSARFSSNAWGTGLSGESLGKDRTLQPILGCKQSQSARPRE